MQGHTLLQAIARVNRVYVEKEGGLVVDYVGITAALKQAMKEYTSEDQDNFGDNDIGESALPKFREKLEICRDLLHGLDYGTFFGSGDCMLLWKPTIHTGRRGPEEKLSHGRLGATAG
jgi:type I restriction enzyme R subunit